MAENKTASTVNLAKSIRAGLNPASVNTVLPTATVQLLLDTLIDLGQQNNPTAQAIRQAQVGFVNSRIAGVGG